MEYLSISELHSLRLAIFDNAEKLHKEADLLHKNKMFSRTYLLAHFCFEELGKIPIIVGAIANLMENKSIDWKKIKKRFYSHTAKISSQNHHYYTFGIHPDLLNDEDLSWLKTAQSKVFNSLKLKNPATYVDVRESRFLIPQEQISERASKELLELTFECLHAHWLSESLTNSAAKDLTKNQILRTI